MDIYFAAFVPFNYAYTQFANANPIFITLIECNPDNDTDIFISTNYTQHKIAHLYNEKGKDLLNISKIRYQWL